MTTHLVLGGGGFLGRHMAAALAGAGHAVVAVDTMFSPAPIPPGIRPLTLDLFSASPATLAGLIDGIDTVHHFAWSTIPSSANADPERDVDQNVRFLVRLLTALRGRGTRLLFASSGGTVYGSTPCDAFLEDHPLRPISVYGASKVAAELYAGVFRAVDDVDVRIARLSNPFGAGQSTSQLQGAISRFVVQALAGQVLEIWGDGGVVRDYLHIGEVTDGMMRLAEADLPAGAPFVFNIGSGVGNSLNDIVALLEQILGHAVPAVRSHGRRFDVPYSVLDIGRAERVLGWRPKADLRSGIERMIADLRADPHTLLSRT